MTVNLKAMVQDKSQVRLWLGPKKVDQAGLSLLLFEKKSDHWHLELEHGHDGVDAVQDKFETKFKVNSRLAS